MMKSEMLTALDDRSREIFRRIVESYLERGEPVGSRNISRLLSTALSPASVRNVMSDLEAMGLVFAPHTSAGRMPTEMGLRFFIDSFLEVGGLSDGERQAIEKQVRTGDGEKSVESLLTEASQTLSGLSEGAGVVVAAKQDLRLKHIEFVRIEQDRALVVLVADDGTVENRVVNVPRGLPTSALTEASNYLNAHIRGRTLAEARAELERKREERRQAIDALSETIISEGLAQWSGPAQEPATLIVRGRSKLLTDLRAIEDLERIRILFDDLETKTDIIQLLNLTEEGEGVRIFIGSENKLFSLSGSSLVVAPFRDSGERVVGVLGVIGPTRLNYARVIPVVDYTAQLMTQLIRR
ncbi:heat-inducible transcriptional repressor [Rhodopseudomonas julia]|uniref:Heat-inducible transcription repressor HrcA n=2 Tax=Nitrobacteraceae TaxID=41294 RepID=A0ABU0C497_9BRAD|nr:heat-inducible transcriptional repressor HrcA [Rhodopseudomonas julia]MDQ0325331.1 heat-inducible transcriptional repressor [Rhodopseudomonas julia]